MRTLRILSTPLFALLALIATVRPAHATFPGVNGRIVFQSDRSGSWQLYTMDSDGGNILQLTNLPSTTFDGWSPSFSPDGTTVAFCYGTGNSAGGFQSDIYLVKADGTGLKQITQDGLACNPHWSPDGGTLAFARLNPLTNVYQIATISSDGTGNLNTLTTEFWSSYGNGYFPGGRRIVFDSQQDGFVSALWTMSVEGAGQRRVTDPSLEACLSDVSPEGTRLLLGSHCNTSLPASIYTVRVDGEDLVRLASPNSIPGSYSPDGKKILFGTFDDNQTASLFTMNVDGSDIQQIAAGVGTCPDGNCIDVSWGSKPR
jgi:TolB protein